MVQKMMVEFQDFLMYTSKIFKLIFWDPFQIDFKNSYGWKYCFRVLFLISMNCSMILGAVLELVFCFSIKGQADMIVQITKTLPIAGFSLMFVTKSFGVIYRNRHEIFDILTRLEKLYPKNQQLQESNDVGSICTDLKRKSLVFIFLNIGGVTIYVLTPIAIQVYEVFCQGQSFSYMMPTAMALWFDHNRPHAYAISYFTVSWSSFQLGFTILVTDLLFCSILCLISMQFRILGQQIQNIKKNKDENSLEKLKEQVKIHQELIEISDMVEEVFSFSLLLSVFSVSLIICLFGYVVVAITGEDHFNIFRFVFLLGQSLVELFLMCYFAEDLIASSSDVATAIYDTNWYEHDIQFKKMLLQMMVKSQKYQKITVSKFMPMSLESFSTIIQSTYSYFTILRTLYG